MQRVCNLAIDVELQLAGRRVAQMHGLGAFVAGKPAESRLFDAPLAREAITDLELAGLASNRAQQPIAKSAGFFEISAVHQGIQSESRITQPAVAVVPI